VAGFVTAAWAQSEYYRHIVFDNSLTSDSYFYTHGMANGALSSGTSRAMPTTLARTGFRRFTWG
jgi:hypothetical protein